jgi:PKD repeat protein
MRKTSVTILLILTISTIAISASTLHNESSITNPVPVKAQPANAISAVSPPVNAQVSITPNVTEVSIKPGTQLNYTVSIANSPPLNGFNVYVSFDPRVLAASGTSIDSNGNILQSVTSSIITQSECISGQAAPNGACNNGGLDGPGVVNLGVAFRGNFSTPNNTNGLLYHLALTVNPLVPGQIDPGATQIHILKVELSPANQTLGAVPAITSDAFFTNRYCSDNILCSPPYVNMSWTPRLPSIGTNITFIAAGSRATNAGASIGQYYWNWGGEICRGVAAQEVVTETVVNGMVHPPNPTIYHEFCNAEVYDVTLLVNDTLGITWAVTKEVTVSYLWVDQYIEEFSISPQYNVLIGTPVNATTVVANNSTISENAFLTVSVDNRTLARNEFVNLPPRSFSSPWLTIWNTTGLLAGTYTVEADLRPIAGANRTIATRMTGNVQLISTPDTPPTAKFVFNPISPVAGEDITFDGSASSDPNGTVRSWFWFFGDGNAIYDGPIVNHAYKAQGNYTVTLIVTDNAGLTDSKSITLTVLPQPAHDVSIIQTYVSPKTAVSTQSVFIGVDLKNNGLSNETVSVSTFENGHLIQTLNGIFVQGCSLSNLFRFCYDEVPELITWNTNGVSPGNYTITAVVSLPVGEVDPTPGDNSVTIGTLIMLPAPVMILNPDNGTLGAQVVVRGNGFPPGPQTVFPGQPQPILITFDDMFLGEAFANNGTFTFTFDVIQSQQGLHVIKAEDPSSGARASSNFIVLAHPSVNLALTVKTGSVYFPGDTLVAYLSVSLNGVPASPTGLQVSAFLTFSNGTTRPMTLTMMGSGFYQATYSIPGSGPLGTYAVVARAHLPGPVDASSVTSFQVQLSWLSSNKNTVMTAATLAGVIGLAGVAWKKGYLRRKDEPAELFD